MTPEEARKKAHEITTAWIRFNDDSDFGSKGRADLQRRIAEALVEAEDNGTRKAIKAVCHMCNAGHAPEQVARGHYVHGAFHCGASKVHERMEPIGGVQKTSV